MAADRAEQIASRLHEEYHTYREDIDFMKLKIQSAVALFRSSRPNQPSTESLRLLQQLKNQTSAL